MTLLITVAISWFVIGVAAFTFWWTLLEDFTTEELGLCFFMGLCGPVAILIGWDIYREIKSSKPLVIMRKRS